MKSKYSFSNTKTDTLQRLQNRAYYLIQNAKVKDNWNNSWLNISNLIHYDRAVMVYKIMNRICPEGLWNKYQPRSLHSTYATRHCNDLEIPRYKTEFAKKGFHFSALKAWNNIPLQIRNVPSLDRFKKNTKAYLKSSQTQYPGRSATIG